MRALTSIAVCAVSTTLIAASGGVPSTSKAEDVGMSTERLARVH